MTSKPRNILDVVKKIRVPEPGTGEFVVLPSVEALCVWMQLNQLKVKGWRGNYLDVVPDNREVVSPLDKMPAEKGIA